MQRSRTDRPWIGTVERCGGIDIAARRLGDERIRDLDVARRVLRSLPAIQAYGRRRSEEHTSELQSLMRTSYAGFCLTNRTRLTQLPCMLYRHLNAHYLATGNK